MRQEDRERYAAYAAHLRDEHRRLQCCLKDVALQWQQQMRRGRRKTGSRNQLIDTLAALRAELARHLSEEESGGCVEEAVIHLPQLSRAALELEHENSQLLAGLDDVIGRLRKPRASVKRIEQDYAQLVRQVSGHVDSEQRILRESYAVEAD